MTSLIVYYGKGVFYSDENQIISAVSLLLFLVVSLYYLFQLLLQFRGIPLFIKMWTFFLIANVLLFIYTGNLSDGFHSSYFVGTLVFMLSLFPFYVLTFNGVFNERDIRFLFIILFPITLIIYFEHYSSTIILAQSYKIREQNNASYLLIGVMPLLFFFKKRMIVLFILTAIMLLLFFSLKRGAIISGSLIFVMYIIGILDFKKNITVLRSVFLLIGFFISLFILYQALLIDDQVLLRFYALENDRGSYRELIWSSVFSGWYDVSDLGGLLIGKGYAISLILSGGFFAHNDWLEILSSFGIFGFSIYLLLYLSAIRHWIKIFNFKNQSTVFGAIVLVWFTVSMYSMWYSTLHFAPIAILLGFLMASTNVKKTEIEDIEFQ